VAGSESESSGGSGKWGEIGVGWWNFADRSTTYARELSGVGNPLYSRQRFLSVLQSWCRASTF
jgi:hypothetical protein